jgi:hypothetical protein
MMAFAKTSSPAAPRRPGPGRGVRHHQRQPHAHSAHARGGGGPCGSATRRARGRPRLITHAHTAAQASMSMSDAAQPPHSAGCCALPLPRPDGPDQYNKPCQSQLQRGMYTRNMHIVPCAHKRASAPARTTHNVKWKIMTSASGRSARTSADAEQSTAGRLVANIQAEHLHEAFTSPRQSSSLKIRPSHALLAPQRSPLRLNLSTSASASSVL